MSVDSTTTVYWPPTVHYERLADIAAVCTKVGYGVGGERLRYIDADEFVRLLREEAGK